MENSMDKSKKWLSQEALINLLMWVLYFIIVTYQKSRANANMGGEGVLEPVDFAFALQYLWVVLVISYFLLPRFFYRKKYWQFFLLSILTFATAILIEEFVLEKVFFPGTRRAETIMGFIPTLFRIGPTVALFVGVKLAWDNLQKQAKLEQVEKEKTESQLQFLKSQLNPHFLFNNLNNLYSYAQEGSPKTPEIVLQLSAMMRYMLYESQENWVPLSKELGYLEDFIRLQELQMENRGAVNYRVLGDPNGKRIAPMILIVFVENSFKHSMANQPENILIEIEANIQEDGLRFSCTNTFEESIFPEDSSRPRAKGIGLVNVQKRLSLQYKGKHHLEITRDSGIYRVDLHLSWPELD